MGFRVEGLGFRVEGLGLGVGVPSLPWTEPWTSWSLSPGSGLVRAEAFAHLEA